MTNKEKRVGQVYWDDESDPQSPGWVVHYRDQWGNLSTRPLYGDIDKDGELAAAEQAWREVGAHVVWLVVLRGERRVLRYRGPHNWRWL